MRRALIDGFPLVPVAPFLAPLLLLVAMHWSAQFLARQSSRLFGRGIQLYLFGLLGTIVHEGSHVIACVLFRHRVHRVKWFDAQAADGALGSVEHSYDPSSAYQRLGTIVIGIAPLLVGAAVILWSARLLLGISPPDVELANAAAASAALSDAVSQSVSQAVSQVLRAPLWRWAVFAYVSISVGGSMHLSASDVRGTWRGFATLALWSAALLMLTLLLWWVLQRAAPTAWETTVVPRMRDVLHRFARTSELLSIAMLLAVAINTVCAVLLSLPLMLSRSLRVRAR